MPADLADHDARGPEETADSQPRRHDADGRDAGRRSARHVSPVRLIRRPWAAFAIVIGIVVVCAAAAGLAPGVPWFSFLGLGALGGSAGALARGSPPGRPATGVGRPPLVAIPAGHW